jgi:hypothetical protein
MRCGSVNSQRLSLLHSEPVRVPSHSYQPRRASRTSNSLREMGRSLNLGGSPFHGISPWERIHRPISAMISSPHEAVQNEGFSVFTDTGFGRPPRCSLTRPRAKYLRRSVMSSILMPSPEPPAGKPLPFRKPVPRISIIVCLLLPDQASSVSHSASRCLTASLFDPIVFLSPRQWLIGEATRFLTA